MAELYCNTCKDYTEHNSNQATEICTICQSPYDSKAKRYVICGPKDNAEVLQATADMLAKEPDAIIINEEVALKHRMKDVPAAPTAFDNPPYLIQNYDHGSIQQLEDMKYSHLSKKEKEADIQPVRTEPKIQRNELCPCGSGLKYKKCCMNK